MSTHPAASLALAATLASAGSPPAGAGSGSEVLRVRSRDGTEIAFECAGSGPTLLIAHGGVGDRTRWTPMFPLFASRFTVCAMDRRGRGSSGDSPEYSLRKEAEDIAAVVESRPGTVFVLGHSYGAVGALEAAFLTSRIARLVLYEPPLQDGDLAFVARLEALLQAGQREEAVATFLREVVKVPAAEVEAMRSRPAWRSMVDSIHAHPRQMRALAAYRMDPARLRGMRTPTLLVRGADTTNPDVERAWRALKSLPDRTEVVLPGQQHNAMDTGREQLAAAVTTFLLDPPGRRPDGSLR